MTCPLCGARKSRRACPALGREICTVCCGTKRVVEIHCPAGCPYLASARAHPPAVLARQRERDARFLGPLVQGLEQRAAMLFLMLHDVIRRHRQGALPPLTDEDVAGASRALASTLETAARGIIYEHQATSLPAQRLLVDMKSAITDLGQRTGQVGQVERSASAALRVIELAARKAGAEMGPGPGTYLDLIDRLAAAASSEPSAAGPAGAATAGLAAEGDAPSQRKPDGPLIVLPE